MTASLRGLVLLATSALLFAGSAFADEATFSKPKIGGVRLDWCKVWGDKCGKPAADAFCKQHEFDKASSYVQDLKPGGKTKVIASGQICNDVGCAGFKSITCQSGLAQMDDGDGNDDNSDSGDEDIAQQGGDGEPVQDSTPPATVSPLGGQLLGELDVTGNFYPADQNLAIFGHGLDNALWWQTSNGKGKWSGWKKIGGVMKYSPSCAQFKKTIWCFVIGQDNALWETHQDKKGGWYAFSKLGGSTTASPSAVAADDANGNDALYVILRSQSGELSVIARYMDTDTELYDWTGYRGLGVSSKSAVTCVHMGGTHVDCYGRNSDGAIHEFTNALTKAGVTKLGGETEKRPGVLVGVGFNQVRVLVKGMDGKLWYKRWKSGEGFANWKGTKVEINSQPACRYSTTAQTNLCFDIGPNKEARVITLPPGLLK